MTENAFSLSRNVGSKGIQQGAQLPEFNIDGIDNEVLTSAYLERAHINFKLQHTAAGIADLNSAILRPFKSEGQLVGAIKIRTAARMTWYATSFAGNRSSAWVAVGGGLTVSVPNQILRAVVQDATVVLKSFSAPDQLTNQAATLTIRAYAFYLLDDMKAAEWDADAAISAYKVADPRSPQIRWLENLKTSINENNENRKKIAILRIIAYTFYEGI